MSVKPKPEVRPGSSLDRHIGKEIADYVREDALSEIRSVIDALLARGCSDFGVHLYDGKQMSDIANRWRGPECGAIPVAGVSAKRGQKASAYDSETIVVHIYFHVGPGLVSANWTEVDGEATEDPEGAV